MSKTVVIVNGVEVAVKREVPVDLSYAIDDIRKPESRDSNHSKTVVLVSNSTTDALLGGLFDVKSDFTFFNPNIKTPAKIVTDSSTVLDGYMQLKGIEKINKAGNNAGYVEYKCVVFNTSSNFMSDIKDKKLNILDFDRFSHTYNTSNIYNAKDHTYKDVYTYFLPHLGATGDVNYKTSHFHPAIFYKAYLKRIAQEAGYTLGGSLMDDSTPEGSQFKNEIIPFTGTRPLITETEYARRLFQAGATSDLVLETGTIAVSTQESNSPSSINATDKLEIFNDETAPNFDNGGVYNTGTYTYTADANGSYDISALIATEMTFDTGGVEAWMGRYDQVFGTGIGNLHPNATENFTVSYRIIKNGANTDIAKGDIIFATPSATGTDSTFNAANGYTVTTAAQTANSYRNNVYLTTGDYLEIEYNVSYSNFNSYLYCADSYISGSIADPSTDLGATDLNWEIKALASGSLLKNDVNATGLTDGDAISLNEFIPKKLKQSDLIQDLITRYNLYISTDPDNDKKLILEPRDTYYARGATLDWTEKQDTSSKVTVKLLTDLQNKEFLFTYQKLDQDFQKEYTSATEELYGQKSIEFDNEFVKGTKKFETKFTATEMLSSDPEDRFVVPAVYADTKLNKGFRVLYFDGNMPVRTSGQQWALYSDLDVFHGSYDFYPYAGHFDNPYTPTIDLNFGKTSYYFYNQLENNTNGTAYQRYWANYINQINEGKLVTMKMYLNEVDISYIRNNLNAKIFIKDSYYYINKIKGYDPTTDGLTTVEFLKIPDGVSYVPDNPTVPLANNNLTTVDRNIAPEVENPYSNTFIITTKNELEVLISAGELVPEATYKIDNYTFKALTTSELYPEGTVVRRVVRHVVNGIDQQYQLASTATGLSAGDRAIADYNLNGSLDPNTLVEWNGSSFEDVDTDKSDDTYYMNIANTVGIYFRYDLGVLLLSYEKDVHNNIARQDYTFFTTPVDTFTGFSFTDVALMQFLNNPKVNNNVFIKTYYIFDVAPGFYDNVYDISVSGNTNCGVIGAGYRTSIIRNSDCQIRNNTDSYILENSNYRISYNKNAYIGNNIGTGGSIDNNTSTSTRIIIIKHNRVRTISLNLLTVDQDFSIEHNSCYEIVGNKCNNSNGGAIINANSNTGDIVYNTFPITGATQQTSIDHNINNGNIGTIGVNTDRYSHVQDTIVHK